MYFKEKLHHLLAHFLVKFPDLKKTVLFEMIVIWKSFLIWNSGLFYSVKIVQNQTMWYGFSGGMNEHKKEVKRAILVNQSFDTLGSSM